MTAPDPQPSPLLVTERQAAAMLSVSTATLYRLRQVDLPYVRLTGPGAAGGIRYDIEDLKAWVARRKVTMKPGPKPRK
jgi:Helix-turn-helix domain